MRDSPEAEVVHSLKAHLLQHGLKRGRVSDIVVDSDGAYRASRFAKSLEPMASIRIDGCRPDIVCSIAYPSHTVMAAFEVKAKLTDWLKGVAQARVYRSGVHSSYLAVPSTRDASDRGMARVIRDAGEAGVGLLVRSLIGWTEIVGPLNPQPLPWLLKASALALRGVSAARRLQLNHPLNYLIVPLFRSCDPKRRLDLLLESKWPDLKSAGTRRHAIDGAKALGLITREGSLTPEGATVADLLMSVGFNPDDRPPKRARLADAAPPLAAVARSVMLRQPMVQLIIESLTARKGHPLNVLDLFQEAKVRDEVLASALFLNNPERGSEMSLAAADFNPSTVFKFKQVLWHSGILISKADASAGSTAASYKPEKDLWTLDGRLIQP